MQDLDSLRQQVAENDGFGWGAINPHPEFDAPISFDLDTGSDHGYDEDMAVIEGLKLPPSNSKWADRLSAEDEAWKDQITQLCDIYMARCAGTSFPDHADNSAGAGSITIRCISTTDETTQTFAVYDSDVGPNSSLLRNGYLAPTPSRPKTAFSLSLLDIVYSIQRRLPSTSTEAMAKAFCDLRNVPFIPHHRTQLSSAIDAYLLIRRTVQGRLDVALGRDSPDYDVKTCCPACMYKLEEEPILPVDMHVTCDGNDSLKRVATAGTADRRVFNSKYYITENEVNHFKDEVTKSRRGKAKTGQQDTVKSECEKRWKNASADDTSNRRPKRYFEETGVFVSMCRHSFVLTICDMIKSGELAKYGLATINKLVSMFGPRMFVGYDIACSFIKTVLRSALLCPLVKDLGFGMCCGAFHGPAHNRACQVEYHPRHCVGTGLTDFENCETLYSSSNRVAGPTRLATSFHRHQKIDTFANCYNEEVYVGLAELLQDKYIAAQDMATRTKEFIENTSLSEEDIICFFEEEKVYLASYKSTPPAIGFAVQYVGLLKQLEVKQAEFGALVLTSPGGDSSAHTDLRRTLLTSQVEIKRRTIVDQLLALQEAVGKLEIENNITERWKPGSSEWIDAHELLTNRNYYERLDELEQLLVRRILERSKAGLPGTGYQMRMNINKSLAVRSKAIKRSIRQYNKAAMALSPPAPKIAWEQVSDTSILSELHILRGSRRELRSQAWTLPQNRQAVNEYHRLMRAQEEIDRLNIEIRRLSTSIADEALSLPLAVEEAHKVDPALGWFAHRFMAHRLAINKLLQNRLELIKQLPGYSGWHTNGVRLGAKEGEALGEALTQHAHDRQSDQPGDQPIYQQRATPPHFADQISSQPGSQQVPDTEPVEDLEVDDTLTQQFAQWQGLVEQLAWNSGGEEDEHVNLGEKDSDDESSGKEDMENKDTDAEDASDEEL